MGLNVLIIGGGGREHALAWKCAQSPRLEKLFVSPGNAGTQQIATNVPIPTMNINDLVSFASTNYIDLTIVGPDDPLAAGIVDAFQAAGLRIFGPTEAAARIEASKATAKLLMKKHNIPTAPFKIFDDYDRALRHVRTRQLPFMVKADGLALGKGARQCRTLDEAKTALNEMMIERVYCDAGQTVVIEDYVPGIEISIHALCDGKTAVLFPPAQDHKHLRDGNQGPMTGGMGTFAPADMLVDKAQITAVEQRIVQPVLHALAEQGTPFTGCLYPGLMLEEDEPLVLEFNARFGDPETQVYMRLLKSDLLDLIEACVEGRLAHERIQWEFAYAVCVVLASAGYPGTYPKHIPITGIEQAEQIPGVVVFHAGTGRVLGVTATGATLRQARDIAYDAVCLIHFDGMQYRKDIAASALTL